MKDNLSEIFLKYTAIGGLVFDVDYDYSIQENDFLKRKYNLYFLGELLLQLLLYIIVSFQPNLTFIALLLLFAFQLGVQVWKKPYFSLSILKLIMFLNLCFLSVIIFLIIFAYYSSRIASKNILSLIILLLAPITYRFASLLERREKQSILSTLSNIENAKTNDLVSVIRLNFFQNRSCTDGEGINILSGLALKQIQDKLNNPMNPEKKLQKSKNTKSQLAQPNLHVQKGEEQYTITQKESEEIDTVLNQLITDKQLNDLISQIGESFRRQENIQRVSANVSSYDISYLTFLLEIQQNFKLFWKQYCSEIWCNSSISLKRQQIMYSMLHRFETTLKSIQKQGKHEESIFNINYLNVIMFDESIKEAFVLLNDCIHKKTSILNMMQLRMIDLNDLSSKIEELQVSIEQLKQHIEFLQKLNGHNQEFSLLNTYYRNYLSFSRFDVEFDRFLHKNKHKKTSQASQHQDQNYFTCQYENSTSNIQEFQNKNSCVIFTSLLNSSVQTIKRTSFNFSKIFKLKNQLAIGKPIEILMPTCFHPAHPKYIREFMESKNVFNNNIQNVVFGIRQDSYIFPCTVNVKVNRIDLFSDFGMTTLIKMINMSKDYILFNQVNMRVISITENLHGYIFKSFKKFHTILIDSFFPFLSRRLLKEQSESYKNLDGITSCDSESNHQQSVQTFLFSQFQFVFIEESSITELMKCQHQSVLENVQFYLLDIIVKKAQYKYVENVYYIEIAQLQEIDAEKNYKLILQQLDSFLYSSKKNSPIFKKIVQQLRLIEQLSDEIQDNPFSMESTPRQIQSSLVLKEHAKSSREILDIVSPTLKKQSKSQKQQYTQEHNNNSIHVNDNRVFSVENYMESQSTGREYQLVNLSKKLRGVKSALQVFTSIHDKVTQQSQNLTQNTPRSLINITQNILTDNQKLILSTKEQDNVMQKINLFKSIKQPHMNNNRNPDIISEHRGNQKQTQLDFSVINTLGLNNSLSIDAGDDLVTINSIDDHEQAYEEKKQSQIQEEIEKEEKIRQSRSTIRYIKEIMDSSIELKSIKIFQYIALICFLTLLIITISQFIDLFSSIDRYQLDFKLVNWPSVFESQLSQVQKSISLQQLTKQQGFVLYTIDEKNYINQQINNYFSTAVDDIHSTMSQMEGKNSNRPIFLFLKDEPVVYTWPSFAQTGLNSLGQFLSIQYNTELHYGIILINLQILRYMSDVGGGRPEYFMMVNQMVFLEAFNSVQQKAMESSNSNLLNIRNKLDTMLILTIVVTIFCLGIQLPIYYFIQKERQSILKLFATFSTAITSKILSRINSIYQTHSTSMGVSTVFTKNNPPSEYNNVHGQVGTARKKEESSDQKIKKQNMSEYKELTRLNLAFLKKIFIIFVMIIIYPILNKVISTQYINQQIQDVNNLVQLQHLKAQILDSVGMNYYALILKLYPKLKPFKVDWYMDRLNKIINDNDVLDESIQNLSNQQKELYNYEKSEYNKNFFPIMEGDLCGILERNNQFNSTVLQNGCSSFYNGVLAQGLILSFRKLNEQLRDFYGFYNSTVNSKLYNTTKSEMFQKFDLYGFEQFNVILTKSIDYLSSFVFQTNSEYYDFFEIFQIVSLVYQLIVITAFFFIEQIIFYSSINSKINKTKKYLKVIDIKSLLSNPFIINYFKKNIKK